MTKHGSALEKLFQLPDDSILALGEQVYDEETDGTGLGSNLRPVWDALVAVREAFGPELPNRRSKGYLS